MTMMAMYRHRDCYLPNWMSETAMSMANQRTGIRIGIVTTGETAAAFAKEIERVSHRLVSDGHADDDVSDDDGHGDLDGDVVKEHLVQHRSSKKMLIRPV